MYKKVDRLRGTEKIAGFVLAGGRSSRLGQDKVLLPWNGRTLLDHAIVRLRQVCDTVRVCSDREDLDSCLQSETPTTDSIHNPIRDVIPDAGPLAGIVAALEQSQSPWNFFLAVDLPLVPVEFMRSLAARAQSRGAVETGSLCVLPRSEGRPQPLCGLYHLSLLPGLRIALEEGKYKLVLALQDAVLKANTAPAIVSENDSPAQRPPVGTSTHRVEMFDPQAFAGIASTDCVLSSSEWFLNINTPLDWQRASELNSIYHPQLPRPQKF